MAGVREMTEGNERCRAFDFKNKVLNLEFCMKSHILKFSTDIVFCILIYRVSTQQMLIALNKSKRNIISKSV